MPSNPITTIKDLLNEVIIEHGSAKIQEKHITLLREQLGLLEKEKMKLETENVKSKKENDELREKLQKYENINNYIHAYGVLWDEEYKMRCLNCCKLLKYSSHDQSIFHCSDPDCDNKHTLRLKGGQKITEEEAIELLRTANK